MARIIFQLTMPRNNAWNNKWSGEENTYTVARTVTEKKYKQLDGYYTHNFGDGWIAGVIVRKAKPREKVTNKFCGYDWMISSILTHGEIKT